MGPNIGKHFSNAKQRVYAYGTLTTWLIKTTIRHFILPIASASFASALSVISQGLALALVIGCIEQMESTGHIASFPVIDHLGLRGAPPSLTFVLAAFFAVFIFGALLSYIARSIAIGLEGRIYRNFLDRIFLFLETKVHEGRGMIQATMRLSSLNDQHGLARILLADARYAGVIVRLLVYNVLHLGYVTVGVAIIIVYAPRILPLVAIFGLLALLVMYPLSLLALNSTRRLEEAAPQRSLDVKKRLQKILGTDEPSQHSTEFMEDIPELELPSEASDNATSASFETYVSAIEARLRIVEYTRLVMALLVAAAIAVIIYEALDSPHNAGIGVGSVVVLLFGLRFVLNGIEGITVTLTSINRFLPHLLRLQHLMTDIANDKLVRAAAKDRLNMLASGFMPREAFKVSAPTEGDGILHRDSFSPAPEAIEVTWRLDIPPFQKVSGSMRNGDVCVFAGPGLSAREVIIRLESAIDGGFPDFSDAVHQLDQHGLLDCPYESSRRKIISQKEECLLFVTQALKSGRVTLEASDLEDFLAGQSTRLPSRWRDLINFLILCWNLSQVQAPISILDGDELFKLNPPGVLAVVDLLADRLVLVHCSRLRLALLNTPGRHIFICGRNKPLLLLQLLDRQPPSLAFASALCRGRLPNSA